MTIKNFVETYTKYFLNNAEAPSVILVSQPGVGKTSVIEQIAKNNNIRIHVFRGAEHDAIDLVGMPDITSMKETKTTSFIKPDWVPDWDEKFIFYCDEINRARIDVRQALFRVTEKRGTDTWKFNPKNHKVILSINPDGDNEQVEPLSNAFKNRVTFITLDPDVNSFLEWAKENNLNKYVINFIQNNPKMLYIPLKEADQYGLRQYPTPRSWHYVSGILNSYFNNPFISKTLLDEIIVGTVGYEAGLSFIKTMEDNDPPITVKDVFDSTRYIPTFQRHQKNNIDKAMLTLIAVCDYILFKEYFSKEEESKIQAFYESIVNDELRETFKSRVRSRYTFN